MGMHTLRSALSLDDYGTPTYAQTLRHTYVHTHACVKIYAHKHVQPGKTLQAISVEFGPNSSENTLVWPEPGQIRRTSINILTVLCQLMRPFRFVDNVEQSQIRVDICRLSKRLISS